LAQQTGSIDEMRMALPPIKRAIVGGSLAELRRIPLPRTPVNKGKKRESGLE
jgi:hypothetical protein